MNYLAHLFLAGEQEEAKLGGLLGDFEKGNLKGKYPAIIEAEIEMHRKIDRYTDSHPIIKDAKRIVAEEKRRYMGIVLDVFYDHLLAKNWKDYSDLSLTDFTRKIYSTLLKYKDLLPEKLTHIIPVMAAQDWLASYQDFASVAIAIERISRRLRRGDIMVRCIADIETNYSYLASGFDTFFPQLIAFVHQERTIRIA
jgi:acyl carrier protein phosphodiesterase